MRDTLLPLLRDNYPRFAKHLVGAMIELLCQARAAADGDLDKFLVLLVITMRTVEDQRYADMNLDEMLSGEIATYPSLHTNIRSIAESTGIPKETVRRKAAALIAAGWVTRQGNDLSVTPLASQRFTPTREATLRLAARGHLIVSALKDEERRKLPRA
jgi:hypothetical protein